MKSHAAFPALSCLLLVAVSPVFAQPYYAAMKGISCAACHINPSGGGARKSREGSPTFINNAIAIGADLRGSYSNRNYPLTDYAFTVGKQRFYIQAEPAEDLVFSYANESGATAEAYGMIQKPEWLNAYARFGRFFLPYGLQISDPDDVAFIKTTPFAPKNAGFTLQPGVSDAGVEVGIAPRKDYFFNMSVTNGLNKTGSGSARAVSGRGGVIFSNASIGVSGFQNAVPSVSGQDEVRYGSFGWVRFGKLVALAEAGQGYTRESSTQTRKNVNAVYAEVDYKFGARDDYMNALMLKGKFDYSKADVSATSSDEKYRYTIGLEWFIKNHFSVEGLYRFLREKPEVDNDRALILGHLWF